jgi:hypothetical protein
MSTLQEKQVLRVRTAVVVYEDGHHRNVLASHLTRH